MTFCVIYLLRVKYIEYSKAGPVPLLLRLLLLLPLAAKNIVVSANPRRRRRRGGGAVGEEVLNIGPRTTHTAYYSGKSSSRRTRINSHVTVLTI